MLLQPIHKTFFHISDVMGFKLVTCHCKCYCRDKIRIFWFSKFIQHIPFVLLLNAHCHTITLAVLISIVPRYFKRASCAIYWVHQLLWLKDIWKNDQNVCLVSKQLYILQGRMCSDSSPWYFLHPTPYANIDLRLLLLSLPVRFHTVADFGLADRSTYLICWISLGYLWYTGALSDCSF